MNRTLTELKENWAIKDFEHNLGFAERAYSADYNINEFLRTSVPASVQTALFNAEQIPDPYIGYNANDIAWIEKKEWWFFKDFETPVHDKQQRILIRFEGITYRAEVWINGAAIGRIEGMFRIDEFDVTEYLNDIGENNRLSLRIRAQEGVCDEKTGINIRTQGPVAQNMYRWNWCPHMVCVGIWRPVKIVLRNELFLESFRVKTLSVASKNRNGFDSPCADAQVQLEWDIKNSSGSTRKIEINFDISGETFEGCIINRNIKGSIKANQVKTISKTLNIKNARLWWPNGLGKPELHRIKSVIASCGHEVQKHDEIFGIREFAWDRNEDEKWVIETCGSTERPWSMVGEMYKWTLVVNGWKVFMKGSNWVMLDSMLRLERWRYERQLSLFAAGGLNFMRVWGGSLAETDDFYDICDRYGIVCWQEFWLACGNYPGMNHEAFIRCVEDTVKRLINRASLVHYSGGNEYEPDNSENKILVDKIAEAVTRIDSQREFRRGSPYKGDRHGGLITTAFVTRNKYLDILYDDKRVTLMRSEVATGRSAPMLSSFEKMMPEEKRWPIDEKMWRNFFGVPCEFIIFANEYDSNDDYEHAMYANYLWHANISRINMEYCRTRMFKCSGNLNWQFNVPWPCMHREIVDMWGVPKPAYYYYVNSSKPVIVSVDIQKYLWNPDEVFNADIYAVNDLSSMGDVSARIKIFTTDMKILFDREYTLDLPENGAVKIGTLDYRIPCDMAKRTLFVKVELFNGNNIIHENLYWIAVSNNKEPSAKIDLGGSWLRENGTALTLPGNDMDIKNPSFEFVILKHGKSADLENQSGTEKKCQDDIQVRYKKKFIIPEQLRNMELEFFTPGFESSDEVHVNGYKIGSHDFKGISLDVDSWCFIPHGQEKSSIEIDPDSEYMFYSDPISLPKLKARFYDIPCSVLNQEAENEIEIVIKDYYQKAVSNPMEIRPRTSNRDEVSSYLKNGIFYSDLRKMPEAKLEVKVTQEGIEIKNITGQLAFFICVEIIPLKTDIAIPLKDNSFSIPPHEERLINAMNGESFDFPARVRIYGWNIASMDFNVE